MDSPNFYQNQIIKKIMDYFKSNSDKESEEYDKDGR